MEINVIMMYSASVRPGLTIIHTIKKIGTHIFGITLELFIACIFGRFNLIILHTIENDLLATRPLCRYS